MLCFLLLFKQCSLPRGVAKIRYSPTGYDAVVFSRVCPLPLLSSCLLLDVSAFATKHRKKELENTL